MHSRRAFFTELPDLLTTIVSEGSCNRKTGKETAKDFPTDLVPTLDWIKQKHPILLATDLDATPTHHLVHFVCAGFDSFQCHGTHESGRLHGLFTSAFWNHKDNKWCHCGDGKMTCFPHSTIFKDPSAEPCSKTQSEKRKKRKRKRAPGSETTMPTEVCIRRLRHPFSTPPKMPRFCFL